MSDDHIRRTFKPLFEQELTEDVLRTVLQSIAGITRIEKVACHVCGTLVPCPAPAVDKQVRAIKELGEYVHGRLPEQVRVEHTHRRGLPVGELTDDELQAVAVEGEWEPQKELPPPK